MILTPRVVSVLAVWLVALFLAQHYLLDGPGSQLIQRPGQMTTTLWSASQAPQQQAPAPTERDGEDWLDSVSPAHRPFAPLRQDPLFPLLKPTRFLPTPCLESWLLDGTLDCDQSLGDEDTLDIVWLWVNGSDARWQTEFEYWHKHHKIDSAVRHFREQNELLYSFRSVLASLKGHLRNLHLILWDTKFDPANDVDLLPPSTRRNLEAEFGDVIDTGAKGVSSRLATYLSKTWRVVQTPTWLNFALTDPSRPEYPVAGDGVRQPRLRYAAHSEIYRLPNVYADGSPREPGEAAYREREWLKDALPTYDSMSIESRIAFLPDMADVAVSFNDDYFLLRPLAVSDFHSPLYGSILRYKGGGEGIQTHLSPGAFGFDGEFGGLFHANYLLCQRYPVRRRPYLEHVPKVITQSLQQEATLMFDNMTMISSSKRFRELKIGHGDLQTQWLQIALRVERWREALLWTWAVAKLGGSDGVWDAEARSHVARVLGVQAGADSAHVTRGERKTLDNIEANFERAGWDVPKGTKYMWTSLDGHMPNSKDTANPAQDSNCTIDMGECFDTFWTEGEATTAAHMFKHLAFRRPQCGDCLLMALVTASGPLGLGEFFPSAEAEFKIPASTPPPPYIAPPVLPITPTWEEADFSLDKAVAKTAMPGDRVMLRTWTMHLLSRYLYTYGKSDVRFNQLRNPKQANETLKFVGSSKGASVLCLNDDIEEGYDEVRKTVIDWFEDKWPEPAVWERS